MAISYQILAQQRSVIQSRCLIAILKYAVYIINEDPGTANHANRLIWAKAAVLNPDGASSSAMANVLGNQQFLDNENNITDAQIQSITEQYVNNFSITP